MQTKINKCLLISVLTGLLLIHYSCETDSKHIDVSDIEVEYKLHPMQQTMPELAQSGNWEILRNSHPDFWECYVQHLMGFGNALDTSSVNEDNLNAFYTDENILGLIESVNKKYPSMQGLTLELTEAFKHYKYYFPKDHIPDVYTYVSEFGPGAITFDTTVIGIGLDMYLGKDYKYYPSLGFPKYQIARFEEEYIVPNVMKAMFQGKFELDPNKTKLIDRMVYNGKIMYLTELMLPNVEPHLIMGYADYDWNWANLSEGCVYAYFVENDLLFSTEVVDAKRYLDDGPTTPGMPVESPGNMGSWLGWQIVRSYMKNNTDADVNSLIAEADGQLILRRSKYRPRKTANCN